MTWGEGWGLSILDVSEICRPGSDDGSGHFQGLWLVYLAEGKNASKLWKVCSQALSFLLQTWNLWRRGAKETGPSLLVSLFVLDANLNSFIA